MTTNKQDELWKRVRDSLGVDCWNFSYTKKKKVYPSSTETELAVKLVRSEVSRVLTDLLQHRSLLSDPQHGEKSVPISVIKAKLKEYESE